MARQEQETGILMNAEIFILRRETWGLGSNSAVFGWAAWWEDEDYKGSGDSLLLQ